MNHEKNKDANIIANGWNNDKVPSSPRDTGKGASANHPKPRQDTPGAPCKPTSAPLPPPGRPRLPLDPEGPRPPPRRPVTQFSDVSSDDDEDRLVIAT